MDSMQWLLEWSPDSPAVEYQGFLDNRDCKLTFPSGVYIGAPVKYWYYFDFGHESCVPWRPCKTDSGDDVEGVLTSKKGCQMSFKWENAPPNQFPEEIDVTYWMGPTPIPVPQQQVLQIYAELSNGRDLLIEARSLAGSSVAKFTIDFRATLGSLRSRLGQKLSGSKLVCGQDVLADTGDTPIINTKLVRGTALQAQIESAEQNLSAEEKCKGTALQAQIETAGQNLSEEEKLRHYAKFLGFDPDAEAHLLWIARAGIDAPLPMPWQVEQYDEDEDAWYFDPADPKHKDLMVKHLPYRRLVENERETHAASRETAPTADPIVSLRCPRLV